MLPSLSTAMVMFSGLVWVGMLTAFGSCTGTVLVITGMVIRKMMSSTSITSTNGVVLMLAIAPPSSPLPTLIAMLDPHDEAATHHRKVPVLLGDRGGLGRGRTCTAQAGVGAHARTAHQIGMQIARK